PEVLEQQINANNLTDFELAYDTIVTPYGVHYNFLGGCLLFLLDMLFEHISKHGHDESFIGIMGEFLNVPSLFVAQPTIRKVVIIGWIALIRDFLPLARKIKRIDWKIVAKMQIEKSFVEGYQIQMNIIYDTIIQIEPQVRTRHHWDATSTIRMSLKTSLTFSPPSSRTYRKCLLYPVLQVKIDEYLTEQLGTKTRNLATYLF
ncbi:hypothetical protein ACTXT7_016977, partial [Hymenolepis weldensis]